MSTCNPFRLGRQKGASLLVALIFLVIMAMLGVTVANVTTLQERMAGHTRDRDLALQAAEAALRDAESRLIDASFRSSAVPYDPANAMNANDDAFWEACFSSSSGACATTYEPLNTLPTSGAGAVARQPKYAVESRPGSGTTEVYRVTARAVGGSLETVVILQAEFSYSPPSP